MRRLMLWAPLLALLVIAALVIYGLLKPKEEFIHSNMVDRQLPAFALPAALPGTLGLSNADFTDGTPKLLNIFASWCIPCAAEAPQLDALKAEGVRIYGVAIRDTPGDLSNFLALHGNPFMRIGADADMKFQLSLGSSGVPETYVIDGKGKIIYQHIGDIREDDIPLMIEKLRALK
jgi:cytochrome c biogenesis protein CcmG, thiol:disulfide interchange protein DsbE